MRPVPDSGTPAAIGFAHESGIPMAVWASSATSIWAAPSSSRPSRSATWACGLKLEREPALVGQAGRSGRRSVVRGTTSRKIKDMIPQTRAPPRVHFRIASPRRFGLLYGVDTPDPDKLLAAQMSEEEMRNGSASTVWKFMSLDGLLPRRWARPKGRNNSCPQYCDACFSGEYPVGALRPVTTRLPA